MEGLLRTGPYMCVRFWVTISTCTRINDRGVKASRTGRLRPNRHSASRGEQTGMHIRAQRVQQHPTSKSRDVKGKAGDSCVRHGATFSPSAQKDRRSRRHKRLQNKTRKEFTHCLQEPNTLLLLLLLLLFLLSASSLRAPQSTSPSLRWTFPAA